MTLSKCCMFFSWIGAESPRNNQIMFMSVLLKHIRCVIIFHMWTSGNLFTWNSFPTESPNNMIVYRRGSSTSWISSWADYRRTDPSSIKTSRGWRSSRSELKILTTKTGEEARCRTPSGCWVWIILPFITWAPAALMWSGTKTNYCYDN